MLDELYLDYVGQLEREHNAQSYEIPPHKWAEIAPEAKEVALELYLDKVQQLDSLESEARYHLDRIAFDDEDTQMWGEALININFGLPSAELKKQISWLRRYLACFIATTSEINEATIQQAREVPLTDLIPDLKLRAGKWSRHCPFHEEKTPSFSVFPDNHYHCFGCGEHGNSIDWVIKTQNLSFVSAVRYLLHL